ncbi:MAG: hypothetical protein J7M40_10405 [Planctomycetes bacterium]|nr:hypothetical protein [Planctomycetota bacterium]
MKNPRVAIHNRTGSFSEQWRDYCDQQGIDYTMVDCCRTDIMSQLRSFDALLFHWHHEIPQNTLIARHVIWAAETAGLEVFPNIATCWSYDDKLSQKYLLEAIGAPLVPTHAFFDRQVAIDWIEHTSFPKVFKLRKGAGARNVRLVRTRKEARSLVSRAFGSGFRPVAGHARDAIGKLRSKESRRRVDLWGKLRRLPQSLMNIYQSNKFLGRERGYVYFQDFVPDNSYDTRITVIGDRAFGFTRNVRENDFRASGSGSIDYDFGRIDPECVRVAFEAARKLSAQSTAFDFVCNTKGQPKIVEISYCYQAEAVHRCQGHWDSRLEWHEGQVWPQDAILRDLLEKAADKLD